MKVCVICKRIYEGKWCRFCEWAALKVRAAWAQQKK